MRGEDLLKTAQEFIKNTPPGRIEFGSKPSFMRRNPYEVRTLCSTLITLLQRMHGRKSEDFVELFGRSSPFAKDYHRAILAESGFRKIEDIRDVRPGDLLAIRYRELLEGFTGHCALVSGPPEQYVPGKWRLPIIDSTSSPHGMLDPRIIQAYRGLGASSMMLLCDQNYTISGYMWAPTSETRMIADGDRMVAIGRWV